MEVAVVDREPVGFLVDAAGVELAVEDPEAVEVAEVVVDNQGKNLKETLDFNYIFSFTYKEICPWKCLPRTKIFFVLLASECLHIVQISETVDCQTKRILEEVWKGILWRNTLAFGKMSHRYRFYLRFVDSSGVLTEEILVLLCVPLKEWSYLST